MNMQGNKSPIRLKASGSPIRILSAVQNMNRTNKNSPEQSEDKCTLKHILQKEKGSTFSLKKNNFAKKLIS